MSYIKDALKEFKELNKKDTKEHIDKNDITKSRLCFPICNFEECNKEMSKETLCQYVMKYDSDKAVNNIEDEIRRFNEKVKRLKKCDIENVKENWLC